jgi:hypothetical protein
MAILGKPDIGFGRDTKESGPVGCFSARLNDPGADSAEQATACEVALEDEASAGCFGSRWKEKQHLSLSIEYWYDTMAVGDDQGLRGESAKYFGAERFGRGALQGGGARL